MTISVVIPARNAARTIGRTLESLASDRQLICETLLVDDGSDDGTGHVAVEAARGTGVPLRVIAGRFGSAGAARNAGLAALTGRHVLLLDADDEMVPGGLRRLLSALNTDTAARMAVGASVRRTARRPDKIKRPVPFGPDLRQNARDYLVNKRLPIAVGSALFVAEDGDGLRFPESIGLDEDTCYWAALLARLPTVAIAEPVLFYNLDEDRMNERFVTEPRKLLTGIAREMNRLGAFGIDKAALQWRKAWVALRIARQLIMYKEYREAAYILRIAEAHADFRGGWKVNQYKTRIAAGLGLQSIGLRQPDRARRAGASQ